MCLEALRSFWLPKLLSARLWPPVGCVAAAHGTGCHDLSRSKMISTAFALASDLQPLASQASALSHDYSLYARPATVLLRANSFIFIPADRGQSASHNSRLQLCLLQLPHCTLTACSRADSIQTHRSLRDDTAACSPRAAS